MLDDNDNNLEFRILNGLLKYNERINKYEKHIQEMVNVRTMLISTKDEKISDLDTKFYDQNEVLKRIKKSLTIIKSENKKNTEKIHK